MSRCFFTFPSLTQAQNALVVLEEYAVDANLVQAPMVPRTNGCAYALQIRQTDVNKASRLLKHRKIYHFHIYRSVGGSVEEVQL